MRVAESKFLVAAKWLGLIEESRYCSGHRLPCKQRYSSTAVRITAQTKLFAASVWQQVTITDAFFCASVICFCHQLAKVRLIFMHFKKCGSSDSRVSNMMIPT